MKNVLTLDVECTVLNKGNPFDLRNRLIAIGLKWKGKPSETFYYPFSSDTIKYIQEQIYCSSLVVGFNIKFDLHWLVNIGIDITKCNIWDCQLGEFIFSNQKSTYPSLNQAAIKYGFPEKIDNIKLNYWEKGIDTDAIPKDELLEYLEGDLVLTEQVYLKQYQLFQTDARFKIFRLQCHDLKVLQEMEYNGIAFNTKKALEKSDLVEKELNEVYTDLAEFTQGVPVNFGSNDHLSVLLYGGIISIVDRIPVGVFKTGAKVGQTRYKKIIKEYELPRLCEPLPGTETKKSREKVKETGCEPYLWEVNETVLRKLKTTKTSRRLIGLLKRAAELDKLKNTYLVGYSKLIEKMGWEEDMLHGNLNQCVVITGRLSSSNPNLQNADPMTKTFMESRYE